jgi:hypothetical protein
VTIGEDTVVEDKGDFRVARSAEGNTTASGNMHLTKALGRQSNSSDMKCGCGELACRWRSIPEVME